MEFSPDDFKRLQFNVYEADISEDFTKTFPELRLYDEFVDRISEKLPTIRDKNKIIKYIAFVYDKQSPYRIKYKDTTQRKVRAILDVGFELDGQDFPAHIEDILMDRSPRVCKMIIAYCTLHYDTHYKHLVLLETMYDKKMKDVFLGSTKDKVAELDSIRESIENTQKEMLQNDQSKGLLKSLYQAIHKDKIELSPEDIANKIKKDGVPKTVSDL